MLQNILAVIVIFGCGCWLGLMAEDYDTCKMFSFVSILLAIASALILVGVLLADCI